MEDLPRHENGVRKLLCGRTDNSEAYKSWHRTLDRHLYLTDVDSIEWRMHNGILTPVAVIELTTFADDGIGQEKRDAVRDRFDRKTMQGAATRAVASALKVPALVVLHKKDLSRFAVWDMGSDSWHDVDQPGMVSVLKGLPELPWRTSSDLARV